jgi:hypothetical protein
MENSRSSKTLSIISVAISLITLFFAYIKPQWIDKSKLTFFTSKYLTLSSYLGGISLQKNFAVVNTGERAALVNRVDCFMMPEKTLNISDFDDAYYLSSPDYANNDRVPRYNFLNGFTVWPNNGYEGGFYYSKHYDQNYLTSIQEIRDSVNSEQNIFNANRSSWTFNTDSFQLSNLLKKKINETQFIVSQSLSSGTFFLCERLLTSDGGKLYQVYTFSLSNVNVEYLKKLPAEIVSKKNTNLMQSVTVDLKLASKEEKRRVINNVEEFIEKFN